MQQPLAERQTFPFGHFKLILLLSSEGKEVETMLVT